MTAKLISRPNGTPTVAQARPGGGVVVWQGRSQIRLDADEFRRLVEVVSEAPEVRSPG